MNVKPIATVVIPCYNYAEYVGRAIESVKKQTANNLECFVVDDGSKDNSKEAVLRAIGEDTRFHYIYQENAGVAVARNNGVFSGEGKYVCCLDADDQLDPRFLETCISYLEDHPEYSIAYTGLYAITGDKGSLSKWPEDSDYDEQLKGRNQIPTCNVARREMWERLGGQRQRYAPGGAGEEDAEMWLRAGAYGFRAKKVTDAGMFIYSWKSGRVSGNDNHKMTNYRAWHPWVEDGKHPFASIAKPLRHSHPVRQYDEPVVAVIIPVGPGHSELVIGALDSIEMQEYRKWEVILAWDNNDSYENIKRAYPYVRIVETGKKGAGAARNRGAEAARAPLLLFLDADDWLLPGALIKMMNAFSANEDIIYSDYVGKAFISKELYEQYYGEGKILDFDEKDGLASIDGKAKDFDCSMAQRQPNQNLYIWNLVTSLVPKSWHNGVGGFDENMKSWEDWDYYIRLAKAGRCFTRVPERLVVYRYYSGERRETGLQEHKDLLKYMVDKYKKVKNVACNCGKKNSVNNQAVPAQMPDIIKQFPQTGERIVDSMNDADYVLVVYNSLNVGQHKVIGPTSRKDYGYHSGGEEFLVHRVDAATNPHIFTVKKTQDAGVENAVKAVIEAPAAPLVPKPIQDVPAPMSSSQPVPVMKGLPLIAHFAEKEVADSLMSKGIVTVGQLSVMSVKAIQDATNLSVHKARALRQTARGSLK